MQRVKSIGTSITALVLSLMLLVLLLPVKALASEALPEHTVTAVLSDCGTTQAQGNGVPDFDGTVAQRETDSCISA